jgi:pyroglutamyl-peptidase
VDNAGMQQPRVLLTGFEPFGGDDTNPSWLVAQALHGQQIAGATVHALQLPCVFGQSLAVLHQALLQHRPQLVLSLGLAAGRAEMSVERVAINVDDARIADNAGAAPIDQPVVHRAPAAYFSTLPIKAMVAEMRAAAVPAAVSQTAGTFVCNHVFFGLMHRLHRSRRRPGVRGGFMHVPLLAEQAQALGLPGLDFETQCTGVRVALHAALHHLTDLQTAGGAVA